MNEQDPRPIDRLIDRERIRGASRMIPEGTDASAVTAEQIETIRNDTEIFCREHGIRKNELAKSVGYGHSTVSEFLTGKYRGDQGQLAR